ncbi:MAG: phosphatase PAP2 family protein [Candidatus Dormiibacterota bacterium]
MTETAKVAAQPSTGLAASLRRGIVAERRSGLIVSLLLIPAILATNLIYDSLNHGPNRIFLETPLDRALPVVPIFAVPYVSLIPYIGVSLLAFMFVRVRIYRSAALTMLIVWFISYGFYIFLQSYIARPHITGTDAFSSMIRSIYAADQPYNDFPSLHTSLSTIIAMHWWRFDRRIGIAAAIWTALIVASTVLVKQHYIADVAGGLALAVVTSLFVMRVTRVG